MIYYCDRCSGYLGDKAGQSCECQQHLVYVTTNRSPFKIQFDRVWVAGVDIKEKAEKLADRYCYCHYTSDVCNLYVYIDDEIYEVRLDVLVEFNAERIEPPA